MPTKLERVLEEIDPRRTYDDVEMKANQAFNSYSMPRGKIASYEEYENILADFYGHVQGVVLRVDTGGSNDRKFYLPQCLNLLKKAFGSNAYHTSYAIAESGKEGGIYNILKKIADLMAKEYAENQINYEIFKFWDNLTVDEKFAATEEYLASYGHLLPNEMTEGNAPRVKAFFPKILKEHPKLIRRVRRVGR